MTMRARGAMLVRTLRATSEDAAAHALISDALPSRLAAVLGPEDFESMRRRLLARPDPPVQHLTRRDLLGALGVFLLVFLSTFPVTIPFMFVNDLHTAMRISNAIALTMLFLLGFFLARHTGGRPIRLGIGMLLLGAALVALTIALGG
jgi:VIT1/CCC1 family predicted Fe2+/Mn2+ transporter